MPLHSDETGILPYADDIRLSAPSVLSLILSEKSLTGNASAGRAAEKDIDSRIMPGADRRRFRRLEKRYRV